jgi:hypothetical protein
LLGLTFELRQGTSRREAVPVFVRIDHVVPRAADPAALERFCLDVGAGRHRASANLDHLCLRVEPFDAAALAKHLAGQGTTCGPEMRREGAEGKGPSIYSQDPEGNGVELKGPASSSPV